MNRFKKTKSYYLSNQDSLTQKAKDEIKARIENRKAARDTLDIEGVRLETMGAIDEAQNAAKKGAEGMANAIGIGS